MFHVTTSGSGTVKWQQVVIQKNYLKKKSSILFKQVEVDHFLEIFSKVNISFLNKMVAYEALTANLK